MWSSPSCGRRAWSDLRNRTASCRNASFPGRTTRPKFPVSAPSSLLRVGISSDLASLVLGDLVLGVLAAGLALAIGLAGFRNVDLEE